MREIGESVARLIPVMWLLSQVIVLNAPPPADIKVADPVVAFCETVSDSGGDTLSLKWETPNKK